MTLLFLMNLGLAGSPVAGPTFKPQWAMNRNQIIGPAVTQPVQK